MAKLQEVQSVNVQVGDCTIAELRAKAEALRQYADKIDKVADNLKDITGEIEITIDVW